MKQLEHKIALITGAAKGIGKRIVEVFAEQGATVYFTYKNSSEEALNLEQNLQLKGFNCKAIQCDGTDLDAVQSCIDIILESHQKVDILVNNAGVNKDNLLLRYSESDLNYLMDNNFKTVFNFSKAIQRTMLKERQGSIINMSSIIGINGNAGQTLYSASKAAIIAFSKSLAYELGSRNIRCNVIAPGFIQTDMTTVLSPEQKQTILNTITLKRLGQPEDIANMALFLASDMSSYITGQVFRVCGGLRA
jgi:3-oxoacyl-[acyl-carrier protein] reductase